MKRYLKRSLVVTCATTMIMLTLATTTNAAQIFTEDFDPLTPGRNIQVAYTFGETTSSSTSVATGAGVTGDSWQTVNTTEPGPGFSGVGAQFQFDTITGNTSTNPSDYILSFDAKSDGGSLNLQIETFEEANFGGSLTGKLNTAPDDPGFGNDLTLNSAYTRYELNLGDTSVFMSDSGIDMSGGTIQIVFQFNGSGSAPFTQTLDVDNLTLTMIPEPATFLLLSAGVLGLVGMRRRNS